MSDLHRRLIDAGFGMFFCFLYLCVSAGTFFLFFCIRGDNFLFFCVRADVENIENVRFEDGALVIPARGAPAGYVRSHLCVRVCTCVYRSKAAMRVVRVTPEHLSLQVRARVCVCVCVCVSVCVLCNWCRVHCHRIYCVCDVCCVSRINYFKTVGRRETGSGYFRLWQRLAIASFMHSNASLSTVTDRVTSSRLRIASLSDSSRRH